jgi:hypothetical protein
MARHDAAKGTVIMPGASGIELETQGGDLAPPLYDSATTPGRASPRGAVFNSTVCTDNTM